MMVDSSTNLPKQLETLFRAGTIGGWTDAQLLARFIERRDDLAEAAFAALVDRHGAMVLRVCRQVLGDEHDAQDAAQATFLVLARRAHSIVRRDSVGSWLHGVALRVAGKARRAADRRRAHERRRGEMMAGRGCETGSGTSSEDERWADLHEELGRLSESFRAPLVLCYLEGLTQEQAAAQLRCPLGTVQSRLARGRAKLKARLSKRGVELAAMPPGAVPSARQVAAIPASWVNATVRMSVEFAKGSAARLDGAGAASAALAEELLRAMLFAKLKAVSVTALLVAVLVSGVATWSRQQGNEAPPDAVKAAQAPDEKPPQVAAPDQRPEPSQAVQRIVRGVVRDEQGRPVARAWIGLSPEPMSDVWRIVWPSDRIRERKEPFRDEMGKIVPAGEVGKYYELRDEGGRWRPIHPGDIRRYHRKDPDPRSPFDFNPRNEEIARHAKGINLFEVRVAKGRWRMVPLAGLEDVADRTDARGRFAVEVKLFRSVLSTAVHFASPGFTRQAMHIVRADDSDQMVEITLRPIRLVRARVIEMP